MRNPLPTRQTAAKQCCAQDLRLGIQKESNRGLRMSRDLSEIVNVKKMQVETRMETWQKERVVRSIEQDISCEKLEITEDACFVFSVIGSTGESYTVEIYEDAELWHLCSCSCEDSTYRPFLCKHMCHVLIGLGMDEVQIEDIFYAPSQSEMNEILANAPDVIGR